MINARVLRNGFSTVFVATALWLSLTFQNYAFHSIELPALGVAVVLATRNWAYSGERSISGRRVAWKNEG